jgi:phosphatidylserine/phosphatidylglycerophosphate/cardiolipin synthase-like enzyme
MKQESLLTEIQQLASALPVELMETLATTLEASTPDDRAYLHAKITRALLQPGFQAQLERLFHTWEASAPELTPQGIALALRAAARVEHQHRQQQTLSLVWTGPDSHVIPLRRTDQVLLQLIQSARTKLTVVSFAVYKAQAIAEALIQAARRNVTIAICLETPEASEGKVAFDMLRAFGPDVARLARMHIWPLDQRPLALDGRRHGSLHAKVAVADSTTLLISSANLTEYAMTLNMEMGVLVQGGDLPAQVEQHFERLMESGVLRHVE